MKGLERKNAGIEVDDEKNDPKEGGHTHGRPELSLGRLVVSYEPAYYYPEKASCTGDSGQAPLA